MARFSLRLPFYLLSSVFCLGFLSGCGTTHPLPPYERPLAHTDHQSVRTTAYTHTESDHLAYGNHNALGGTLRAAPRPVLLASNDAFAANRRDPMEEPGGFRREFSPPPSSLPPFGSAAADWSRWPAGTTFRLESTGQCYRVDDYGWALAGRNTIDLYQPTRGAMNAWGVRREELQILHWGSRAESLRLLRHHQEYRHIKRMVLELEGKSRAAARLQ